MTLPPLFTAALPVPHVRWEDVAECAQAEALALQCSLLRVLELWDSPLMTRAELEKLGVEAYAREFGRAISERQVRRLLQRTITRDAGRKEWTRRELFLPDNPPLRAAHPSELSIGEEPFAPLLDIITAFAKTGQPSPEEEALLWLQAWRLHQSRTGAGLPPKTCKAELLLFLRRHASWLTKGRRNALRMMVARQFSKHDDAEKQGRNPAEAALDGRIAKRGKAVAPEIPKEDIEKLVAYSLFNCGGRLAQAERELVELREESGISAPTLDLMDAGASKSYVNTRIAKEARPLIDMASPYLLGKKAVDDATPSLRRDYSKLRSMQVVTADDFTMPVYFWLKDANGNPVLDPKRRPLLTRGQVLLFIDVRSLKIITWVLIPARNYDSLQIRTGMNVVCLEHGRPDVWYFEKGLWQRSNIVKGRPPKEWRLAHGSEAETQYGWEKLGVRFIHAMRARSKPAELVGGLLQDRMERCRGYCGRDERRDCPEETKNAKLAVEARRVHPSKHFYSFDEWLEELGRLIAHYNADVQQGTILDRRSPDQAFEEFWPHEHEPVKFDPSSWHLCAHYVSEREVTKDGITFQIGNQRFNYCDEENIGLHRHRKVRVYFDPGHPQIVGVTDLAGKNPFFVKRSNPVDFLGALDGDGPDGEAYRNEVAKQSGFSGVARAVFRSAKTTFQRNYRKQPVDRQTAALGTELLARTGEALKQSSEVDRRKARIVKLANRLGKPVETLRDFSDQTEQALKRTWERRQATLAIEANPTE